MGDSQADTYWFLMHKCGLSSWSGSATPVGFTRFGSSLRETPSTPLWGPEQMSNQFEEHFRKQNPLPVRARAKQWPDWTDSQPAQRRSEWSSNYQQTHQCDKEQMLRGRASTYRSAD
ncbi:hypothetical protein EYF80_007004 [Liparis tanakae]|uniref:Uncharacterized protein n=1 Tax=Liparis tanakae TaxID=230148 RepID=A0A4Z2IZZ1_9TELE|nr:hypothetical protein EYF80_007004 [Liparis tanakae]